MNKKEEYGGDGDYGGNDDGDDGTFLFKWFQMYALANFMTMMVITKILKLPEWGNGRRGILITNPTHNRGRSTYEKESQSTKAQLQGII